MSAKILRRFTVIQQRAGKDSSSLPLMICRLGCIAVTTNAAFTFERAVTCNAKQVS